MTVEPTNSPGLRERKKADVRRAVREAAERLFREKGYDATTMSEIAKDANIARKTLFNYFETKESIVLSLVDSFIGEHMPDWLEPDEPTFHDARDILTPDVDKRLVELADHRWLLTLAANHTGFFSFGRTPYIADKLQANILARERRIAAIQREGRIRKDVPALEISRYYEALRDLTISNWLRSEDSTPDDLSRMFHNAMRVLIQGIESSATARGS